MGSARGVPLARMPESGEPQMTTQPAPESTLCVFPWAHLFVDPVGVLTTCCVGEPNADVDEDGALIRAGQKDAIARHWRSPRMRAVRQEMAAGRRHRVCDACWRAEARGLTSYRQCANDMGFDAPQPGEDCPPPKVQFVDLRLGNACNLK